MAKYIVTQQDLDNNPDLALNGLKIGDEIDIPTSNAEGATFGPGTIPNQPGPKPPTKPCE